jgi:hypothetical protein
MCVLIVFTIAIQFMMNSTFDPLTFYLPVDAQEFPYLNMSIPGIINNVDQDITNTTIDSYENTYMHPAIRHPTPVIWIPQDYLGIAVNELQRTRFSDLNLLMSIEGAKFNEKTNIEIDRSPPDHLETTELNNIRTLF